MPSYIQITDEMCLVHQEVSSNIPVTQKKEPVNHIWIYDRSGSMYHTIKDLTEQLKSLSKKLPKGDTLSLGWFSGEGDFNFIIKGFKIGDDSDYNALERAIKANNTVRNTTCFSEILADINQVISDLAMFSDTYSMHFFTDGYPVVRNYHREIDGIFTAIGNIKGKINSAMFVGYGYYYNKELMSQMAEKLGALLIHSSMVPEYADSITKLVSLSETQEPKQEVDPLVSNPRAVFTLTDQGVMLYSIDEGKLHVSPQKGKTCNLFYITNEQYASDKGDWEKVNINDIDFAGDDKFAKGLYASALVMTQQVQTDLALEFIGKIGDKRIVDALTNAFTIEEYGNVEAELNGSIEDVSKRFAEGRDPHYLPAEDAFCVFDLLNILVNDEKAVFYPYHKEFRYEKIGIPSKTKDGYPKFIADENVKCAFNNLVWHSSRLNLNVLTRISGVIHALDVKEKTAKDLGLPEYINTFVFRNYTFIKDGRVHTKRFPVTTSEATYNLCKSHGLVRDEDFSKTSCSYTIDVSGIPAINRKIATGRTSATELCKASFKEQTLKAHVKSLKWLKTDILGEEQAVSDEYNDEQIAFLEANGLNMKKEGIFAPEIEVGETKDHYQAKSFKIKIAKYTSLPTVKKVMEKISSGKSRNPVEELMEEGINKYNAVALSLKTTDQKAEWFNSTIAEIHKVMRGIRAEIQETKFAIILGKKWFDEFDSYDETSLEVDGVTFNFDLGEDTVSF